MINKTKQVKIKRQRITHRSENSKKKNSEKDNAKCKWLRANGLKAFLEDRFLFALFEWMTLPIHRHPPSSFEHNTDVGKHENFEIKKID